MPRPELIFLHSANGGGCNARELCKGQHLVALHTDFDGLCRVQNSSGRCFGSIKLPGQKWQQLHLQVFFVNDVVARLTWYPHNLQSIVAASLRCVWRT
jgi:hypothetical protein